MAQDAVLNTDEGYYDFSLDSTGQIEVDDFLDTAIDYSILGEARADASEIAIPELQRGWIGNEGSTYENGGKVWIYIEQTNITRTILNKIQNSAYNALEWLITDELATSIDEPVATATGTAVELKVTIRRSGSRVINRSYVLWNNTGIR